MDPDRILAAALGIVAVLWLLIAVAIVAVGSSKRRPTPPPAEPIQDGRDFTSPAALKYHQSNQLGRN